MTTSMKMKLHSVTSGEYVSYEITYRNAAGVSKDKMY